MSRTVFVGMFFLFLSVASFGLEFLVNFDVICGSDSVTAGIGVSPSASDGLDIYDEVYIGFPPAFALYFESSDTGLPLNLTIDVRNDADSIQVWDGTTVMETGSYVVLRWESDSFPADSGELKIGYHLPGDTVEDWIDMTVNDSISYPVGNRIQIVLYHEVPTFEDDTIPPEIISWSIADGETIYDSTMTLSVIVVDTFSGVDTNSVEMTLNGIPVGWFLDITTFGDTATFSYTPLLSYNDENTVLFSVSDLAGNTISDSFTFYYRDSTDTIPPDSLYEISGFVMLSGGGLSLSGTKVYILELSLMDTTNAIGQFSLPPVPSDTYTIVVEREEYIPIDTAIYLISDTTLMFTLEPSSGSGVTFSGTVLLEGESDYSGSMVTVSSFDLSTVVTDTTDILGMYSIELPTPGMYKLLASHEGFLPDSLWVVAFWDTVVNLYLEREGIVEQTMAKSLPSVSVSYYSSSVIAFRCHNVVQLDIFNLLGHRVCTLPVANASVVLWNTADESGDVLPAGTYFARAYDSAGNITVKRLLLLR